LAFASGVAAIAVALLAAFYAVGLVGGREDVIIVLNGVDLHRPVRTQTAVLASLLLGTLGLVLVLRSWPRIRRGASTH
jgi:hypothetical protein